MKFTDEQIGLLQAKLDKSHVRPPQKFGPKGDYLEGWHVIAEANRIFGFDAWSYEAVETRCVAEAARKIGREQKDGWGVTYTSKVRVIIGDVVREDFGAGHGYDLDLGLAHESAVKEAVTDALKRALRTFGNPFGLALYDKSRANVDEGEPRTTDQRSAQGRREVANQISAAAMKRGLADIDKDLLDCHSPADVKRCGEIWKSLMERDGWSKDYIDCARDKFAARLKQIKDSEAADVFPGDRQNGADLSNHPINAG